MPSPSPDAGTPADEDLLAACLRGEQDAWDRLIERYDGLIYSIALNLKLSEADASDIFQSVCVTLLQKLNTVRDPRRLAAWIATTTTRECYAVLRERKRMPTDPLPESPSAGDSDSRGSGAEVVDTRPMPDQEVLAVERKVVVRHAVSQLSERCRALVEALFTDELQRTSYQELADRLGIPQNSLGPTRARCLEHLRRLLDAAGYTA